MQNKNAEQVHIIVNPKSTGALRVSEAVLDPLAQVNRRYELIDTRFKTAEDNIKDLADRLPSEGKVINAAGDGTAMQLVNAMFESDKDLTLGFMDSGNFSDIANAHKFPEHTILDLIDAPTVESVPLSMNVNGEHFRYAPAYITLGLTAVIAAGFDNPQSRSKMQEYGGVQRKVMRLAQAGRDYIKFGRDKLPAFSVDGGPIIKSSTDIAIANNPVAAGMVRSRENYYDSPYFGARADLNMTNIFKAALFGVPSILGDSPLDRAEQMSILFEEASTVPVENEGEFTVLSDVKSIFIYKDAKNTYSVLHPKAD